MIYLFYPRGIRIVGLPPLRLFDYSRKQASSKHEKLETSTRGITGRRKGRGEKLLSSFPLPFIFARPPLSQRERDVWERGRSGGITYGSLRACLHGGGGPQVGEVTRLGGVTRHSM